MNAASGEAHSETYHFERIGLWCCVGFIGLFFIAMWPLAGFIPPPSPSLTGEQLIARFSDRILWVQLAIPVGMLAGTLSIPWSAVLALQVAKMGPASKGLAMRCFGAGLVDALLFILQFIFWGAAFYRPNRSPELIRLINDMAWLEIVLAFGPWVIQTGSVAVAGLLYRGADSVFPRWFCFMSLWVCVLVMPGAAGIFFYEGPFCWNGILAFWLPVVAFGLYYLAAIPIVYKAINTPRQPHVTYMAHAQPA